MRDIRLTKSTLFKGDYEIVNIDNFIEITNVKSIDNADDDSLVFIVSTAKNKEELISKTRAKTIICDITPEDKNIYKDKCLIISKNPKLEFAKIVNKAIESEQVSNIHPTAIIHPDAKIGKNVQIGAYVVIGKSVIGDNVIIYPNVSIYNSVKIGRNVVINSGTAIGVSGFGYVRDENNVPVSFPQLGGVVIGDNVDIGANVCIDKGALQDTHIGNNTKIGNFSQIAHNVIIGENTYIIGARLSGSVCVGDNCWIAPSRIMNKKRVGNNVTVGYGSIVVHDIEENKIVLGYPAESIELYSVKKKRLDKLLVDKYK